MMHKQIPKKIPARRFLRDGLYLYKKHPEGAIALIEFNLATQKYDCLFEVFSMEHLLNLSESEIKVIQDEYEYIGEL